MISLLGLSYADEALQSEAEALAKHLALPMVSSKAYPRLELTAAGLSLLLKNFKALSADFHWQHWKKRVAEGKSQALIRACKIQAGQTVLDCTAGWGRDSALLAAFGAQVTMLERHPMMVALLKDALKRQDSLSQQKLDLTLRAVDAIYYLEQLKEENQPDVIYIDPMHPEREKSALVKKEMQALQALIGSDDDAVRLLQLARKKAKKRVVLKWPQKAASLMPPDAVVEGKTVRYDLYFTLP